MENNYDDLYRLTNATRPALTAEAFGYDRVGNRLTSADAASWTYNQNNALVSYDGVNYTYDANGNTISKSVSGQMTAFAYGAKDRLDQVNLPDGRIATYKYDAFNRRISKTVDGATTYFMYADDGLVAEMNSSGAVTKTYGWKPGGTWGTDPVLMAEAGQMYFYHNDHLGTPQKMTDATGAVVWSAAYTAFGEATVDSASTVTNNLRFPGQYYDAETGLHYNFHRYYDPKTGRYLSEDPIGLKGGYNFYIYVKNNTINLTDPIGLLEPWPCEWCHKPAPPVKPGPSDNDPGPCAWCHKPAPPVKPGPSDIDCAAQLRKDLEECDANLFKCLIKAGFDECKRGKCVEDKGRCLQNAREKNDKCWLDQIESINK